MNRLHFFLISTLATLACAHAGKVEQSGAPVPIAAADSSERPLFHSDTIRPWGKLSRGWNRIPGREGTGCAHDSIYAFKVRPGLPDKVMIYLNGGGMCWRATQCDPRHPSTVMSTDDPANDV